MLHYLSHYEGKADLKPVISWWALHIFTSLSFDQRSFFIEMSSGARGSLGGVLRLESRADTATAFIPLVNSRACIERSTRFHLNSPSLVDLHYPKPTQQLSSAVSIARTICS
ncbi:hypothetical protein PM082_019734 [Marasmius tenuissimus]|nr:hypothetical protein PM082_019734 [Marasmius tenuissimus]